MLLGHNVNEKKSAMIFTPELLYGQVPQEVESKPDILASKYNKRNGFRSRLVAVSSAVLYSQNGDINDKHNDLSQNIFGKEIKELEKPIKTSALLANPTKVEVRVKKKGVKVRTQKTVKSKLNGLDRKSGLPNTLGFERRSGMTDPSGTGGKADLFLPTDSEEKLGSKDASLTRSVAKQIIIYTRSRRTGELLENNSFHDWQNNIPYKWKSDNVLRTKEALTGSYGVRLGSNPEKKAYIYQDIVALPGYFYEIKCNFKMPVAHARSPAIKLLWLNSNTEIIEYGIKISITTGEKPYYQYISGITTKSPRNVVYGRVYFEKHDTGVLDIDMVSFICF